jgi:uncharacterized iron-regulated membrane protein
LVGAWSSPVILILGITGLYFNAIVVYHELFEHPSEDHYKPTSALYSEAIDFNSLLEDSPNQLNEFTPTYILYPFEPDMNITIFGYLPSSNPFASNYSSTVSYDSQNGNFLAAIDGGKASAGTQVFDSFRELHFGSFAGLASKIIWSVFGLSPFILGLTGVYIWWRRKIKSARRN